VVVVVVEKEGCFCLLPEGEKITLAAPEKEREGDVSKDFSPRGVGSSSPHLLFSTGVSVCALLQFARAGVAAIFTHYFILFLASQVLRHRVKRGPLSLFVSRSSCIN